MILWSGFPRINFSAEIEAYLLHIACSCDERGGNQIIAGVAPQLAEGESASLLR